MSIHRRFRTEVVQLHRNCTYRSRACVDILPIRFNLYQVYANYNQETDAYDFDPPLLLLMKTLKLRFSRERASGDAKTTMDRFAKYKRVIAQSPREANKLRKKLARYLSTAVGLPEGKHLYVIDPVMKRLQHAVPDKIFDVAIMDMIFRAPVESTAEETYYRNKLIPATESFIQALKEASPPDDELECAICREMLAPKKDSSSSITQLPCSHYFHRDCIVPWLHIKHLCPTCRRPNAPSR